MLKIIIKIIISIVAGFWIISLISVAKEKTTTIVGISVIIIIHIIILILLWQIL